MDGQSSFSINRRGTRIWCPHCETINPSHVEKPERFGLPRERRYQGQRYNDVQWFRRVRVCDDCSRHFVTGELPEELILELLSLRSRTASILKPKVNRAIRQRTWLSRSENIPKKLAEEFVEASAWWLVHPSGIAARAPGHADRILLCHRHGWTIDFGANTFLVGKALERCRSEIHRFYERIKEGDVPRRSELVRTLKTAVAGSVANHLGEEYQRYPDDGHNLVFGTQSINLDDATQLVIENSGIEEFLSSV